MPHATAGASGLTLLPASSTAPVPLFEGVSHSPQPMRQTLDVLVDRLDRVLGSERCTIMRVRKNDWEARTYSGLVGRGHTASEAVDDLLRAFGENLAA